MKKLFAFIFAFIMLIIILIAMSGCNRQVIDLTYKYDRAVICLPSGKVIEGTVDSWRDYEDGDQIQVKIDGVTYLVHSSNIVLIG